MRSAIFVCICLLPGVVFGADSEGGRVISGGLRMTASLLLIIGAVYLAYYLLRKRAGWLPGRRNGVITIREMVPLGGRRSLCLVRVHGRELLLGLGGEKVECLGEFEAKEDFPGTLKEAMEKKKP